MLSYRHSFHAGNFADVLKHLVLIKILEYLGKKDKPNEKQTEIAVTMRELYYKYKVSLDQLYDIVLDGLENQNEYPDLYEFSDGQIITTL